MKPRSLLCFKLILHRLKPDSFQFPSTDLRYRLALVQFCFMGTRCPITLCIINTTYYAPTTLRACDKSHLCCTEIAVLVFPHLSFCTCAWLYNSNTNVKRNCIFCDSEINDNSSTRSLFHIATRIIFILCETFSDIFDAEFCIISVVRPISLPLYCYPRQFGLQCTF
jgi:hypothetical protein